VKKAGAFTFELSREGIETRVGEMDKKLERLRSMYESFFMGVERTPPNTPRREMNRLMLEMQQVPISNSSLRFRFQALSQKWVLLVTYWNRTLREIEAGTFRRDLARAQRHMEKRGGFITEEEALTLGIPKSRVKAFVARQERLAAKKSIPSPPPPTTSNRQPPPIPGQARPSPSPPALPPPIPQTNPSLSGISEKDFEQAYDHYVEAHKEMGILNQVKSKDRVRQQLSKVLPKILEERKCSQLRIEVAVEEGKVRLRAWPALVNN
jgi:hypothetical protein